MSAPAPRVGLYFDLRNPGARTPWPEVYARALERAAEGERRGLGAVWTTEHHRFADGYLPQPLTFCAALATRTAKVRIGTAVVLAPLRHAQHLAEEAAVVDILSNGRLELGIGSGYRPDEFETFGVDRSRRMALLEEAAIALPRLWSGGGVTPPPIQDPVPLWVAGMGPKGARMAGRVGSGLLWIGRELLGPYLEGLEEGGHAIADARMGGLANVFLADDPERAREAILGPARAARATYREGSGHQRLQQQKFPRLEILTPADAAASIADRIDGLPVTDVFCFDRIGDTDPDLVDRHVELVSGQLAGLIGDELAHRSTSRPRA